MEVRSVILPAAPRRKAVEQVKVLGVPPWKAPEPLSPIDEKEVLVVWWRMRQGRIGPVIDDK